MIQIDHYDFFGYKYYVSEDLTLINIMVDPEMVELKTYKRTPFASIMIRGNVELPLDDKKKLFDEVKKMSLIYSMKALNMYIDDEYDYLQKNFPEILCHTIIFYIDTSSDEPDLDSYYLISAIPIRGIVTPFGKSLCYQLLNGSFINCKPFKYHLDSKNPIDDIDQYYNKIIYVLTDIKSKFDFQEYMLSTVGPYGIMIDHLYSVDYIHSQMILSVNRYFIPSKGRDQLFTKSEKNIFYLSDVPKNIMTKSDAMIVKL